MKQRSKKKFRYVIPAYTGPFRALVGHEMKILTDNFKSGARVSVYGEWTLCYSDSNIVVSYSTVTSKCALFT